jgi:hypothetical protein
MRIKNRINAGRVWWIYLTPIKNIVSIHETGLKMIKLEQNNSRDIRKNV